MKQIDFEEHWLNFLNIYVRPLQEKVFIGYVSEVGQKSFFLNTGDLFLGGCSSSILLLLGKLNHSAAS